MGHTWKGENSFGESVCPFYFMGPGDWSQLGGFEANLSPGLSPNMISGSVTKEIDFRVMNARAEGQVQVEHSPQGPERRKPGGAGKSDFGLSFLGTEFWHQKEVRVLQLSDILYLGKY